MASAVAGVLLILSLWQGAKNMQFANNIDDDNIVLDIATVSTAVANNNSVPDIWRLINM